MLVFALSRASGVACGPPGDVSRLRHRREGARPQAVRMRQGCGSTRPHRSQLCTRPDCRSLPDAAFRAPLRACLGSVRAAGGHGAPAPPGVASDHEGVNTQAGELHGASTELRWLRCRHGWTPLRDDSRLRTGVRRTGSGATPPSASCVRPGGPTSPAAYDITPATPPTPSTCS